MKNKNGLHVLGLSPEEAERRHLLQAALGYLLPAPKAEEAAAALLERFGDFGLCIAGDCQQEDLLIPHGRPLGQAW